MRVRNGGSGEVGGDGSETGLVTTTKEEQNRRQVSVPVSPRTSEIKRRETCL